jgi:Asp-tRNA(Asn)/Glu-tRNA(Gln) amidotransferase C subunit
MSPSLSERLFLSYLRVICALLFCDNKHSNIFKRRDIELNMSERFEDIFDANASRRLARALGRMKLDALGIWQREAANPLVEVTPSIAMEKLCKLTLSLTSVCISLSDKAAAGAETGAEAGTGASTADPEGSRQTDRLISLYLDQINDICASFEETAQVSMSPVEMSNEPSDEETSNTTTTTTMNDITVLFSELNWIDADESTGKNAYFDLEKVLSSRHPLEEMLRSLTSSEGSKFSSKEKKSRKSSKMMTMEDASKIPLLTGYKSVDPDRGINGSLEDPSHAMDTLNEGF